MTLPPGPAVTRKIYRMETTLEKAEGLLEEASALVNEELDRLLPSETTKPEQLHKAIRHSVFAGGKRFRPALLIAVGKAFGADPKKLLSSAAAVEMMHTYSLIHDDLPAMDDDSLRRGKPTCHVEFGESTAILAGDGLQTLAFETIAADEGLSAEIRIRLVSELASAAGIPCGMVAGQQFDLESEGDLRDVSEEEIERIHRSKTGAMIRASARCGAIVAGADRDQLDLITEYAEHLGLIFQIIDDLLDITETTETLGKTAGKDEVADKATYPAVFGIHEARNMAMGYYWQAGEALNKLQVSTAELQELLEFIMMRDS
ncbi:MAG: polyprenyl synthetase family protein [Acidobacteria bacterium]|nr:MAG: polyprenyl synthetase family protein [Acidobacteriota bacterium]REJ98911.1 MAG: polyprenyl synthetase family protein [Acidobacteriota bacterium]REK16370.1 MAG: polyprenyl synthetase family protein [Acidobacteriota bacterium]REK44051.1 MAG: polyprenyl synthetase family protein [Acidobacteriota bacterium]